MEKEAAPRTCKLTRLNLNQRCFVVIPTTNQKNSNKEQQVQLHFLNFYCALFFYFVKFCKDPKYTEKEIKQKFIDKADTLKSLAPISDRTLLPKEFKDYQTVEFQKAWESGDQVKQLKILEGLIKAYPIFGATNYPSDKITSKKKKIERDDLLFVYTFLNDNKVHLMIRKSKTRSFDVKNGYARYKLNDIALLSNGAKQRIYMIFYNKDSKEPENVVANERFPLFNEGGKKLRGTVVCCGTKQLSGQRLDKTHHQDQNYDDKSSEKFIDVIEKLPDEGSAETYFPGSIFEQQEPEEKTKSSSVKKNKYDESFLKDFIPLDIKTKKADNPKKRTKRDSKPHSDKRKIAQSTVGSDSETETE